MVSASEQMGARERLVLFEARYGKRKSRCQQEAIERGRAEHAKFLKDGARSQSDADERALRALLKWLSASQRETNLAESSYV